MTVTCVDQGHSVELQPWLRNQCCVTVLVHCVHFDSRQSVCCTIVCYLDVSDVGCELGDKVQVTYGARGITSRGGGQGICE